MVKDLKFVSPESEGIYSKDILEFIRQIEEHKINLHSFIMVRNGNIIAESYAKPFDENFAHRIYSATKTFVALAVGLAITEGKLKLTDKIVNLLKNHIYIKPTPRLMQATVYDCLTMSLGHIISPEMVKNVGITMPETNVNNVIDVCAPGTRFLYNTGANILGQVIKEITGKDFFDYLRPVLDELEISKDAWCVKNAFGTDWGGSGIIMTLRDFAKVGEFILNLGKVNAKQLIDKKFMKQATTMRIFNGGENSYIPIVNGGYGYFTWLTPDAVCLRGMGSQQCYCFKGKNFIFACQGDTQCAHNFADAVIYDMLKLFVYDRIGRKKKEGADYTMLKEKLSVGIKRPMFGQPHAKFENIINGKTYVVKKSDTMGWKWFRFDFDGDLGTLTYENARGEKQIKFGLGSFYNTTFPETHYYDVQQGVPADRELNCETVAEWVEAKKLLLRVYITDTSFGNAVGQFSFKGKEATVLFNKRAEFCFEDYVGVSCAVIQE